MLADFLGDQGIEGEFHLVDGDVIGGEFENFINAGGPVFIVSPIMPAMRSILTWAKPTSRIQSQAREDFGGEMGTAVFFEDLVVEIFNAKREAGDSDIAEGLSLSRLRVPGSHSKVTSRA